MTIETTDITGAIESGDGGSLGLVGDHFATGEFFVNESGHKIGSPPTSLVVDECPVLIKTGEFHNLDSFSVNDFDEVFHLALGIGLGRHSMGEVLVDLLDYDIAALLIELAIFFILLLLLVAFLLFLFNWL